VMLSNRFQSFGVWISGRRYCICIHIWPFIYLFIYSLIHSYRTLSHERYVAFSEDSSPQSAI
jgi:hypothetical protein